MSWIVTTPPKLEPVGLTEAKAHLRIFEDYDDVVIAANIAAARTHVENVCEHALMPQSWQMLADRFEGLTLPGGNVRAVTSIAYTDSQGAEQVFDPAKVVVDATRVPARVSLAQGASWPLLLSQANVVRVTYEVGYASLSLVPAPLKAAILLIVGDLYENREAQNVGGALFENATVMALLRPYRRVSL